MSSMASTPPSRRVHLFINHSPETYEAKISSKLDAKKQSAAPTNSAETRPRSGSKSSISSQSDSDSADNTPHSLSKELREDTRTPPSGNDMSPRHYSQSSSQFGRDLKDVPRKRRRTSPNELYILETEFSRNSKPCKEDRERIASLTSMDEKAVQVWFQNKRQSCRRQQSQVSNTIPTLVRTQSMPAYQNENTYEIGSMISKTSRRKPFGMPLSVKDENAVSTPNMHMQLKSSKALKLSMSADGKAELVERSPLKQLSSNTSNSNMPRIAYPMTAAPSAARFATMPALQHPRSGVDEECASSLLVLKSGQWR